MALTLVIAAPAFAQCAPEPTQANATTTCTGTDPNGLTVTTYGTSVVVPVGATILGGGRPGIAVQLPSTDFGNQIAVSVAGRIDGGTQPGVSLLWQAPASGFGSSTANLRMTIAPGGTVTGTNAIVVGQNGSGFGNAFATIDNAGTLTGTNGVALLSTAPSYAGFSSITNRATGTIGAISGQVGTLTNAGTIDGGTLSAIDFGTAFLLSGAITNTGTITANGSAATLANLTAGRGVTNSGTIVNRGSGAAMSGDSMILTNAVGGLVSSGGATAILARTYLSLTNAGTITGNVVTAAQPTGTSASTVDSSAGTINGSVTFGAGNDTLVAIYDGTSLVTGITGAIDGGAGTDTVRLRFATTATVASALALPTGFERLSLAPDLNVTATLATGFVAPAPLQIAGSGTVLNRTTLSATTQVVTATDFSVSGSPSFVNAGTIGTTAGISGVFALNLSSINRFENSGIVSATGDGVSFSSQGVFLNTGSITATGTGVSLFGPVFTNSGTIRSTAGTGVILSGSSGSNWTNSGRIDGAVAGARLSSGLVNTGTIASAGTGVLVDSYGFLDNRAGGIVSGGAAGISSVSTGLFNAVVSNAGTINGNVRLVGQGGFNANRYFALAGGILNGNLTLGFGDMLVAELANPGTGTIAGITGSVTGNGSVLRYRVRTDASATLAAPAGFTGIGYDLFGGATLTLAANATVTQSLTLAGQGVVDLSAAITASAQPAIGVTSILTGPNETAPTTRGLSITSRGALTLDHADGTPYPFAAVSLGGDDSFTNAGTITVRDRATTIFSPINAIANGKSITNSGTIMLDAATGVSAAQIFVNAGTIGQIAGGRAATGVRDVAAVTNTGTIDVAGSAVLIGNSATITNSGRIASSGSTAIGLSSSGSSYNATITNLAGGTIAGGSGRPAIQLAGGTLVNAGLITGSVDLGYAAIGRSFQNAVYVANGGTVTGDLRFGQGDDVFVAMNDATGIGGTIDGGAGNDLYVQARSSTGAVTLGALPAIGFELRGVRAIAAGTVLTINAAAPLASDLYASGDGAIVNATTVTGAIRAESFGNDATAGNARLASFTNNGGIAGGFDGTTANFANAGTIGSATLGLSAVSINDETPLVFANTGVIANNGGNKAVTLAGVGGDAVTASNSGSIVGGLTARSVGTSVRADGSVDATTAVALTNSGSIATATGVAVALMVQTDTAAARTTLTNSGTIEATGPGGTAARLDAFSYSFDAPQDATIAVTNSGTIRADGGSLETVVTFGGTSYRGTRAAAALVVNSGNTATATIGNAATGLIEATGLRSAAILSYGVGLDVANAGTIRGGAGTVLAAGDALANGLDRPYFAGAIQTLGVAADRIVNTGTITGSIDLGSGADVIENRGRIDGDVFLGAGDDSFLQRAGAVITGIVDGGVGTDSLIIDATGGGAINGSQFVNFERVSQIGQGNVVYSGLFSFDTIGVSGSTVTVAAGQTLGSSGGVTLTGGDGAETVVNNGTIAGSIMLAAGNDRLANNGTILGSVSLGDGDDQFTEGTGSRVVGSVDGGAGSDLYTVLLAGNRSGIGARTGFERLGVEGTGTLSLTLDQSFDSVSLAGTGLNVALAGRTIGAVTGTDAAETFTVDGDVASVALGGGDDQLSLATTRAAGRYDGGGGTDVLRFTAVAPVTLAGNATGFEQVALAGNALVVTGSLGSAGAPLSFGAGDQQLTIANGGTLAGIVDLGAGNDSIRLAAGASLNGTVSGGAGNDIATIELAGARTLTTGTLTEFETLVTEGTGALTLGGTHAFDRLVSSGDMTVATGAVLTAPQVQFGSADNRFTIAGRFVGSVDGGAGTDTITVSGGTAAAPVAFGTIANVEAFGMSGGFATVSGTAALGSADLSSGRLVGLAGSTIGASQIVVRQGATFGSAGAVNGNILVAGTLSPGASPGTMTVNGNVSIQAGSVSLFELTSTVSDKLIVNGTVGIASGATLQIAPIGTLRPGVSYDLIVASGGISGAYSTVVKPDGVFGVLVQRADRIQLLGQFLVGAGYSPQVTRSIAYANAALAVQPTTSSLFDALPSLLTATGESNPIAFAQLTPEPYASASQIGIDNALTLAAAARGPGFATTGDDSHAYTFAQTLGGWHRLGDDSQAGTAMARSDGYGFLGGIGIGNAAWSVGAFAGYLNDRQRIDSLGARTSTDGVVAGVHGRYLTPGGIGVTASILYDGGKARTNRALPGSASASGGYGLHSLVSDLSISVGLGIASDWNLRPRAGITYVRTTRDAVTETGGSPFALTVARDRHVAGFADAGLSFGRSDASTAAFRPYVSLGARYQIEGRRTAAIAGYAGGGLGLSALGASRSQVVGTATGGIAYRLQGGLDLFGAVASQTGRDDHQESVTAGLRLRF